MTIGKAQNNTVNTYIKTKAFHTQPPTIWLHTDTSTLTITSSQAHACDIVLGYLGGGGGGGGSFNKFFVVTVCFLFFAGGMQVFIHKLDEIPPWHSDRQLPFFPNWFYSHQLLSTSWLTHTEHSAHLPTVMFSNIHIYGYPWTIQIYPICTSKLYK